MNEHFTCGSGSSSSSNKQESADTVALLSLLHISQGSMYCRCSAQPASTGSAIPIVVALLFLAVSSKIKSPLHECLAQQTSRGQNQDGEDLAPASGIPAAT